MKELKKRILKVMMERGDSIIAVVALGLIFGGVAYYSIPVSLIVIGSLLFLDVFAGNWRGGK